MNKSTFDNEPNLVEYEGMVVRIDFDIEKTMEVIPSMDDEEPIKREVYKAYVVRVEQPLERGRIINAIITAAYPSDKMQAIINNHLLDPTDEEHEIEYNAMQKWRIKAKQVAADVIATISK